jgi:gliding motility-associated-like protein
LERTVVTGDNCYWQVSYVFWVTDACGNELTGQEIVHSGGSANTPPALKPGATLPGGGNYNACKSGAAAAVPAFNTLNVAQYYEDSCGGAVTITLDDTVVLGDDCNWTVSYVFTVTACGVELTPQEIVYNGSNQTAPTGTAPAGITGINACLANAKTAVPAFDATAAAAGYKDACNKAVTVTLDDTVVDGDNCNWSVTYVFTVTDDCGNELAAQEIVHRGSDQTAPVLAASATLPGGSGYDACKSGAAAAVPAFSTLNVVQYYEDSCGAAVTATLDDTAVLGTDCDWTVSYVFTITDACGNELPAQEIVYKGSDQTAPTLKAGATLPGGGSYDACKSGATAAVPAFSTLNVVQYYEDACGTLVTATLDKTDVAGTDCAWTLTYEFTITDACGNKLPAQTIVYNGSDQTAPVISTVAGDLDRTLCYGDTAGLTAALALAPAATDVCSTVTIHLISDTTTPVTPGFANIYRRVLEWNFTDVCGNTTSSFKQTITVNDKPAIGSISAPAAICSGGTLAVTVPSITDNGQPVGQQGWLLDGVPFNPATPLVYPDDNGKELSYFAENSCGRTVSNTQIIMVDEPVTFDVSANVVPSCYNEMVTFSIRNYPAGATINWASDKGVLIYGTDIVSRTHTETTVYTVTVTKGACSLSKTIKVEVTPEILFTMPDDRAICEGSEIELRVTNIPATATSVQWTSSVASEILPAGAVVRIAPETSRVYTATVSIGRCSASQTVNIQVDPKIIPAIVENQEVCPGEPVTLWASGGTEYLWSPAGTLTDSHADKTVAYIEESTVFTVLITRGACQELLSTVVELLPPVEILDVIKTKIASITVVMDEPSRYTYKMDGGEYRNSNEFDNLMSGLHVVTVRNEFGCVGNWQFPIKTLEIPDYFTPNDDGINDNWVIKGIEEYPDAEIMIYDRESKLIQRLEPTNPVWDGRANGRGMPSTDYWYNIYIPSTGERFVKNFTLKR